MKMFNLNDYIYFKLTEEGVKMLKGSYRIKDAGNGLYKMQTWEFCGMFGKEMKCAGQVQSVETTVFFEDKDLKEESL